MSTAFILEPKDFDRLVIELKETIREEIAKLRKDNPDPPMSRKQAAKYLGMNDSTLHRKFKSGEYPAKLMHRSGKRVHFFRSELEAFIKKS